MMPSGSLPTFWNGLSLMQELADRHDFPTNFYLSICRHGIKKLESLIAVILLSIQISSPLPLVGWDSLSISPATAVLYSPDTKVPRTGELALRKAIPANTSMKTIQVTVDDWTNFYPLLTLNVISLQTILPLLLGIFGGYLIPAENSTEKAIWDHGGECEESFKGIYFLFFGEAGEVHFFIEGKQS